MDGWGWCFLGGRESGWTNMRWTGGLGRYYGMWDTMVECCHAAIGDVLCGGVVNTLFVL